MDQLQSLMRTHHSELSQLLKRQRQDWRQLLTVQKAEIENGELKGMAFRHAREREQHNDKYNKEKRDLMKRQQQELEQARDGKTAKEDVQKNDEQAEQKARKKSNDKERER